MTDYTPTTEAIRCEYSRVGSASKQRKEAFDRWLAEVKADAWQDGAYHIAGRDNELVTRADTENPYRQREEQ